MSLFQWIVLPVLWLLLTVEVVMLLRHSGNRRLRLVRFILWSSAAITIAVPEYTADLANFVGIHRGADLVFYFTTLALIALALAFYSRCLMLQQQITELVRHVAIQEARQQAKAGES